MIRSWVGYTLWVVGLCLLLGVEYTIQQRVARIAAETFHGEMTMWTQSLLAFVLGMYVSTILIKGRSPHMNKKLLLGAFIPLFLLSGYPVVAILAHWMIPFAMSYMTIYRIFPILAGLFFMVSVFDFRTARSGS